mmetsp:Transcript_57268/g.159389  ORF Transcript_57268/g.159389 Transcript_57268/m.159389 type:complete len:248 (-) Transcript_57268:329-1072(-)
MLRLAAHAKVRASMCGPKATLRHCHRSGTVACEGMSVQAVQYDFMQQILTFPKRRPFATNVLIATVKTSLADLVVQSATVKDWSEIDWRRNFVFTAFGCAWLGGFQWFVYVDVFSKCFPNAVRFANAPWKEKLKDNAGQRDLLRQAIADNFVYQPCFYFPVFYLFKQSIQGDEPLGIQTFTSAMQSYGKSFFQDVFGMAAIYFPADILVYSVPMWMRLPMNHAISFGWTLILSFVRGGDGQTHREEA